MKPKQRSFRRAAVSWLLIGVIALNGLLLLSQPVSGAPAVQQGPVAVYRGTSTAVRFDVSLPLRSIPSREAPARTGGQVPERPSGLEGAPGPQDVDPSVQTEAGSPRIPAPSVNFDAFSNQLGYTPPDPVGDVGPNHYVAMGNVHFAVYSKSGALLYGPVTNNTLWDGFGGPCENENSGDPIVLYDQLADRWMLTQFTSAGPVYYNCVALSTSGDPTGSYYRWAFSTGNNFPDYPKYGVWPDAYYISTREFLNGGAFVGVGAYALNRAQMIAGNPSPTVVSFLVPPGSTPYNVGDGLLPTDMDGSTLPPAGTPNFFMGSMDNGGNYGAPQDALTLWRFHVDWGTPGNSTFTLASTLPTDPFDSMFPCGGGRDCIPQPGTTEKVDILSYRQRPLWRLAYRNMGSYETLVTNQSVEAASSMAGIRWYEVRDPNGSPFIYQQSTYAPGTSDGIHRWMGSIAMDKTGNLALGYSASDGVNTYPSIWYTGRLAGDPLGQMTQGEGSFQDGLGSQLSTGSRWGDYTSMNVDPVDDCTFWYINEYYPSTSSTGWRLHVGSFVFPSCLSANADLAVSKSDSPDPVAPGGALNYTLAITNAGPEAITTTATVVDVLPAGVTLGSFSAPGWNCNQVGQQLTCTTNSLPVGSFQIGLSTTAPTTVGYITNTATITSTLPDFNQGNNVDRERTLVDTAPLAAGDAYTTTEDTALVVAAPGVLGNDSDPDGDALAASVESGPLHGTLTLSADGSFTYTPDPDYYGADSFTYVISDDYLTATALVSLDVAPVNDAPVAADDTYTTPEDTPLAVAAPGILGNDSDPDGDALTASVASGPLHGTLALNADGSFTYTPDLNYNGPDSFSYVVSDGVLTASATVDLSITPVNDAPVAVGDAYTTTEDTALVVAAPGVLSNDSDLDGDALAASVESGPLHGALALSADGSFTYTPDLNYNGPDSFSYLASDGDMTATALVDLVVLPVNDVPVVDAGADQQGEEGAALSFAGSFFDPGRLLAGEEVLWTFGDGAAVTGTLTPTHAYGDDGVYTVTLTVTDTQGAAGADTLVVTVTNVAPALDPLPDLSVGVGEALTLTGVFTDPGRLDTHLATIDWGNGVTETQDLAAGVTGFTSSSSYAAAGVYTVTVTVVDDDGGLDSQSFTVTVNQTAFQVYLPVILVNH